MTVRCIGGGHDMTGDIGPKSASEARRMILSGEKVDNYIPKNALDVYSREESLGRQAMSRDFHETAMLSRLRMFGENYYNSLPDSGGGLGNRLYKARMRRQRSTASLRRSKQSVMLCQEYAECASARRLASKVPQTALRRTRVLTANSAAAEYLRVLSKDPTIPVITKPAAARTLSAEREQVFELSALANELYVLAYRAEQERRGGQDWRTSPKIVQND